jgi:hypothetical protein
MCKYTRFEVSNAIRIQAVVFWVVTPCSDVAVPSFRRIMLQLTLKMEAA